MGFDINEVKEMLKEEGYKLTTQRLAILNVIVEDKDKHLSPEEIYENEAPKDISELWLKGDHYKWRAMRSCGVSEAYCTGDKSGKEKFEKFAYTLQYAIGNPLYHWAHIELQKYFGINTPLSAKTADDIYDENEPL